MPFKMLYNYSMRERPLVLLIDDEEIFLEIASVKLQADGLDTVMTQDFEDAIVKAETLMPDFILSDIFMPPGRSGWELALELRKNPKTRAIKFAFFTSLRDPWLEFKGAERRMCYRSAAMNGYHPMQLRRIVRDKSDHLMMVKF